MKILYRMSAAMTVLILCLTGCSCNNGGEDRAKYIFLFIGDGMGHSQVAITESYLSYKEGKFGGEQLSFTGFPIYGTCTTHSLDYYVTCSSAAGTAIACGQKTKNNHIGVDEDGKPLESIATALKRDGYKIGIISNVQSNHATPAAFYAHQSDRGKYYEVGLELAASGFDFFAGSGFHHARGNKKGENLEPLARIAEKGGYKVCYGTQEFNVHKDSVDRLIFIQESGRQEDTDFYVSNGAEPQDISLAQMMNLAISFIGEDKPFFMMCEGGEIDWAAHANNTMATIHEILNFEQAVNVAIDFYLKHPEETLIIVTGDHETGGVSLGDGDFWKPDNIHWDVLEKRWEELHGKDTLTVEENKRLNEQALIGWTTQNHTGAPVPVFAIGKGSEKFQGRIDNADIKGKILGE